MNLKLPDTDYLRIKVIPKSQKTELVEIMEDASGEKTIKIRVAAAPERGRANAELIKFLSSQLGVPQENISIISGKTHQLKLVKIKR
ncbi:MAG: DUF167 domain-containing protein [Candidatus Peregrinibacteria bacterium]